VFIMAILICVILLVVLGFGVFARWREGRRWRRATFEGIDKARGRKPSLPEYF
jgi:hypothetical protein